MNRWLKYGLILIGVLVLAGIVAFGWYFNEAAPIGTGYVAKYLCSSTFISKREAQVVFDEDVSPVNPLAKIVSWEIDHEQKTVTASSFGMFTLTAIYREGSGCSLVIGTTVEEMRKQKLVVSDFAKTRPALRADTLWPTGSWGPVNPATLDVDPDKLTRAIDRAFAEPSSEKPRKTRAVVVIYKGRLIAERYAPGFHKDMPLLGWSMSKSITNALVGILSRQQKLDIHQPAPVPEWQGQGDARKAITLDQLLRMSSGLEFEEVYAPLYDATDMLYGSYDFAAFAAAKPLKTAPDSEWYYSSGTANITARIVRQTIEKESQPYYRFLYEQLFDRIGMYSAVMEPDSSGTFVGSSYTFATPRDWARFGQLYLQDGVWNGERILPEGWVKYSTTPTPKATKGEYSAYFWLNAGNPANPDDRRWPGAPPDTFAAQGFQGQSVVIIPSRELVLVRFGATSKSIAWSLDEFIKEVLAAMPL